MKSSTSTGVRASDPSSDPRRDRGVTANIHAPIERTTITAIAGILIVLALPSCSIEWMSSRYESYVFPSRIWVAHLQLLLLSGL